MRYGIAIQTKPKSGKKSSVENRQPKDKFMYKERSYEALMRNQNPHKSVDITSVQNMLAQKKVGSSFLAHKVNKINFMN